MIKRTCILLALLLLAGCHFTIYSATWDSRPYDACEPYCDEEETE